MIHITFIENVFLNFQYYEAKKDNLEITSGQSYLISIAQNYPHTPLYCDLEFIGLSENDSVMADVREFQHVRDSCENIHKVFTPASKLD